jgi:hypothetical protein
VSIGEVREREGSKIRKGVIVAGIGSGWRHRASMVRRVEEQVGGPVRSSDRKGSAGSDRDSTVIRRMRLYARQRQLRDW